MIYFLMLAMPASAFNQQTTNNTPPVNTDYLQKCKKQKTAAWVFLSAGTAMMLTGSIIWSKEVEETVQNDPFGIFYAPYTTTKGTGLSAAGLLVSVGSIPFFIASGKNKRRARNMSTNFKMEKTTQIPRQSFIQNSYPALSVKIAL